MNKMRMNIPVYVGQLLLSYNALGPLPSPIKSIQFQCTLIISFIANTLIPRQVSTVFLKKKKTVVCQSASYRNSIKTVTHG